MKYLMSAEWWKAAGIRAAKTMFQTGAALVVTQLPVEAWTGWQSAVPQSWPALLHLAPALLVCRSWRREIMPDGILGMDGI